MPLVPPPPPPPSKLYDPWLPPAINGAIPLSWPAVQFVVSKYDPGNSSTPSTILFNVVPSSISMQLGSNPPTARFRYVFGTDDPESPQSFEEALSTSVDGTILSRLVEVDDRIVVHALRPSDETWVPVFYGFALGFHLGLSNGQEAVFFDAVGAVKEAFNIPISGVLWRDSNKLTDPTGDNIAVEIPGHFNPGGRDGGQPNCVPSTGWSKGDFNAFPVFCDAANGFAESWDLTRACRYLIYSEIEKNPIDDLDVPEGDYLDALLVAQEPIDGKVFDPDDSTTFTKIPIEVADKPIDAKSWPMVVEHLIADKGFAFAWELTGDDADGSLTFPNPRNFLSLFRPQSGRDGHGQVNDPKQVWLQPRGSVLDLAYSNLGGASISRDVTEVVNEWDVNGELEEWEVSIVLAPGFSSVIAGGGYNSYDYETVKTADASIYNAFRLFVADEAGEGHYLNGSTTKLTNALDLNNVLGVPVDPVTGDPLTADPTTGLFDPSGVRQWVQRRRPTLGQLLTQPTVINGSAPYKAKLSYSFDYAGNGMQTLTPSGTISGGTATLSIGAATTTPIAYDAVSVDVKNALGALSTVGGVSNVYCTGGPLNKAPIYVFFVTAKAGVLMPNIAVASSLTGGGTLSASTQSTGGAKYPAVWNGSGSWNGVAGNYTVLKDRIGIYIDCLSPNNWNVGKNKELKLIECLQSPSNVNRPVYLRLTCTFRGDRRCKGTAKQTSTTVGGFEVVNGVLTERVKRSVEARDRYKKQTVHKSSEFVTDSANHVMRDDTTAATAEAVAMQQATIGGILGGPITIPWFTDYYKLGDRIDKINGRSLGFRTDDGNENVPIYPIVTGVNWSLEDQVTTLTLSDANLARHSYASKIRAPKHGRNSG